MPQNNMLKNNSLQGSVVQIDLNCDLGESFGIWHMGNDQAILPIVSSVNIACGFHAGDPATMYKTVKLALENNVAIGAHPGTPDLVGFGRRNLAITAQEAYEMVVYQIGALNGFIQALGGKLHHVKPHGALYNMAAVNASLSTAIAHAVLDCTHPDIILYGLANSELIKQADKLGLRTANEVFADRTYQADGTLTPRNQANALIVDEAQSIDQVLKMVLQQQVTATNGKNIPIVADTVCIHGDGAHALAFAQKIKAVLSDKQINISAM